MPFHFSCYRIPQPLVQPYCLSFGDISIFDTFYIKIVADGHTGLGEITPLPGYNHETISSVQRDIVNFIDFLKHEFNRKNISKYLDDIYLTSPFVASGIYTAFDTWQSDIYEYDKKVERKSIPIIALISETSPDGAASAAKKFYEMGHETFKLKVGRNISNEIDIIKLILQALNHHEHVNLRLDANQNLDYSSAMKLCSELENYTNILLEQPFKPGDNDNLTLLLNNTSIPVMLDESIWTVQDILTAQTIGINTVKLKLCKHKGIIGTEQLLKIAKDEGLNIIFGNGVQSVLGNFIEYKIFVNNDLSLACESNGFSKIANPTINGGLQINNGQLQNIDFENLVNVFNNYEPISSTIF